MEVLPPAPVLLEPEPVPLAPVLPLAPPVCAIVAADMANNAAAVAVTNSFNVICCSSEDDGWELRPQVRKSRADSARTSGSK